MNIIEEIYQKDLEYQDEDIREVMLCIEKWLTYWVNNALREAEWPDVNWINCRVIVCEEFIRLKCELEGEDLKNVGAMYVFTVDPPTIVLKTRIEPSSFLHECYHHYQFVMNRERTKKGQGALKEWRTVEREARRAQKDLYANYNKGLSDIILKKCGVSWEESGKLLERRMERHRSV